MLLYGNDDGGSAISAMMARLMQAQGTPPGTPPPQGPQDGPPPMQGLIGGEMPLAPPVAPPGPPPGPSGPGVTPPPPADQSMIGRVHDWLKDRIVGENAPRGYEGLLSPEDIASARPSLMQGLIGDSNAPSPGNRWKQNLDSIVAAKTQGMGMAQIANAAKEHQKILAGRAEIAQKYQPQPGETQDAMDNRLESMFTDYLRNGDVEMAKATEHAMGEVVKRPKNPPAKIDWVNLGGKTVGFMPGSTTPVASFDHMMSEDEKAKFALNYAEQQKQHGWMKLNAEDSHAIQVAHEFDSKTKGYTQTMPKYASFLNSIDQAKKGNPAALQSALYGFVSNTDLNAQMRQGILEKLEQVAPGIKNKAGFEFEKALQGKLQPSVIKNLESIVLPLHQSIKAQYKQMYEGTTKRTPRAADFISPPDEMFDLPGAAAPAVSQGGKVNRYLNPTP